MEKGSEKTISEAIDGETDLQAILPQPNSPTTEITDTLCGVVTSVLQKRGLPICLTRV